MAFNLFFKLFSLFFYIFNFFVFEAVLELIHFIGSLSLLLMQLLNLTFNILNLFFEISFLYIEIDTHEFIFYFVNSTTFSFKLFLFISVLVHLFLVYFISLHFTIKMFSFFCNPVFNLLQLSKFRKNKVIKIHVSSRKCSLFVNISLICNTSAW